MKTNDLISRAAIEWHDFLVADGNGMYHEEKVAYKRQIDTLPPVQPELHYDEWCTDCKEYDQERHCCPRFNRVIRGTVEEYKAEHPEPCDDPRADVYYLAEKIGIHRLYALVVELRGEPEPCEDAVSRQAATDIFDDYNVSVENGDLEAYSRDRKRLCELPSVQPEPISDAYMNAVWTWLLDYQIKAAELKGRYTPYEVLSWVANDWRKEHE